MNEQRQRERENENSRATEFGNSDENHLTPESFSLEIMRAEFISKMTNRQEMCMSWIATQALIEEAVFSYTLQVTMLHTNQINTFGY